MAIWTARSRGLLQLTHMHSLLGRASAHRTLNTAASPRRADEGNANHGLPYQLCTKSHIRQLFEHFAPRLDYLPFFAAAHVFPLRVNNYFLENLIDWLVISPVAPSPPLF